MVKFLVGICILFVVLIFASDEYFLYKYKKPLEKDWIQVKSEALYGPLDLSPLILPAGLSIFCIVAGILNLCGIMI